MPTIKDIAQRAGVSVATVSYVINNSRNVSPERKKRVLEAIKELNYTPNAVARGLRMQKTRTIGLILSDITNPFFPDLAKACEDFAQSKGYTVVVINTDEKEKRMERALSLLREEKVDGAVIASALVSDNEAVTNLKKEGYPIVLAHRRLPGGNIDTVSADNFGGAYTAVRHFILIGHTRIAMIAGNKDSLVSCDRVAGYRQAMADFDLPVSPEWVHFGKTYLGNAIYQTGYSAAFKLLDLPMSQRPTAVVCTSDIGAFGVMDAARNLKLKIPDDLALIGFDDLFISSIGSIQLSAVRTPRYDIGASACRLLIERIGKAKNQEAVEMTLPTKLIIRQTCGTTSREGLFES